jgi:hypothetical protein
MASLTLPLLCYTDCFDTPTSLLPYLLATGWILVQPDNSYVHVWLRFMSWPLLLIAFRIYTLALGARLATKHEVREYVGEAVGPNSSANVAACVTR